MKILIPLLAMSLLTPKISHANFLDFFGASTGTMAIGGQANGNSSDPANNYYAPSLLAWSQKLGFSFDYAALRHDFEEIENIVVKNSTNHTGATPSTVEYGGVNTDYPDYRNAIVSLILPLRFEHMGNLALTYSGPVGSLVEVNSGHPTLPEYVLYHARYRRSMILGNYVHPINEHFSFSAGMQVGLQTTADVGTQASLSGTGYGSSASARAKVSPSVAALLSVAAKMERGQIYLTYSQEMKQNLRSNVNGEMNDPPVPFDIEINSMTYFDPHTFRLGGGLFLGPIDLYGALEYQLWEHYQTPLVKITKRSTLESSDNYERIKAKNIFIPHLGLRFTPGNDLSFNFGVSYRPTPLEGDFSNAGNSVDCNTLTLAAGPEFRFRLMQKELQINLGLQYQKLEERTVTKTSGQENGNAGDKIGAPYYKIGGHVFSTMLGLRLNI